MLLIKNITNMPITIEGNTIDPNSSKVLDIKYNKHLSSLERVGALSIIYVGENSKIEDVPPIEARKRRNKLKDNITTSKDNTNNSESE